MKVYTLKIYDNEWESESEIIGIFDDIDEMITAILQHKEEIGLAKWADTKKKIKEYMDETPLDGNELMKKGLISDYELNIDYSTKGGYRTPSLNGKRKDWGVGMTTIKEARQAAGLSQQGVTDALGIPRRTLQDWEAGKRTPPGWAEALVVEKLGTIAQGNKKNSENPVDNTISIC